MRPTFPVALLLAACSSPSSRAPGWTAHRIATIPPGVNVLVPPAYARDGSSAAYVVREPDGDQVVHGDWRSKTYSVV